jgi:hypothetical protein
VLFSACHYVMRTSGVRVDHVNIVQAAEKTSEKRGEEK